MSDPCVVADGLEKRFDEEVVLTGVDLAVETGELLALMGPNGVGKSVLFSCLAGSERPSGGSVEVFGADPTTRSDTTSFLLQDALAIDRLTGRENVRFYRRLHPQFTDDWRRYAETLGIDDDLEKPVEDYSGGMKRKLELTIALAIDVPLYLLDEPTAALDLGAIGTVHELLREKQADGKTIVLSSHRALDADIADRIAFVADGRVVESGPPEALFAAVPPVAQTTLTNADALEAVAVEGRVFQGDGGIRGFLPAAGDGPAGNGDDRAASDGLDVTDPTYTDLFNYYTAIVPSADGG